MHLFFNLLLAHLFADFPLQTDALARYKSKHLMGVVLHVMIYMVVTSLMISDVKRYWPLLASLGIAHFLIDVAKPYLCKHLAENRAFVLDQCLHMVTMLGAAAIAQWWWDPAPRGAVPDPWLPYALLAASLPAFIVAYWIWAHSNGHEYLKRYQWQQQFYRRALMIEQRFGLIVIALTIWVLVRSGT